MPLATVNDVGVIELRLALPRVGVWHAEVTVDTDTELDHAVTLDINGQLTLSGHVRKQGLAYERLVVDLIGGNGNLGVEAPKKNYRAVTLGRILNDLLNAADESISGKVAASLKNLNVQRWSTAGGRTVGVEIQALVDEFILDGAWRFMPDGTLWLGRDQFKEVRPAYDLVRIAPQKNVVELVSDDFLVQPGDSLKAFDAPNVSYATHNVIDGQLRSTLFFEDA